MTPVAVVTDSTASLPAELATKWSVNVVGMRLSVDGALSEEHLVPVRTLLRALRQDRPVFTTPPDPATFAHAYADAAAAGARAIVSVHLSAKLSGTVESARAAAARASVPVYVLDSNLVGMSLGFAVLSAARVAAAGGDAERVRQAVERRTRLGAQLIFVDTLEYLRRGGRIGGVTATVGKALSVKPVLAVRDGEVVQADRGIGTQRALRKLVDTAVAEADGQGVDVALEYVDSDAHLSGVRDALQHGLASVNDVVVTRVSTILGAHVGPGALGVAISPL